MFEKSIVLNREVSFKIALSLLKFTALVGVATLAPLLGNQSITGPIVNATLFIAVVTMGWRNAILIGLTPSLIALMAGTLPSVLAPMVPFIAVSNAMLIVVFGLFAKKPARIATPARHADASHAGWQSVAGGNYWLGIASASFLKFVFLFGTSAILINLFNIQLPKSIALMMSYPQLLTALAGGVIAYLFLKTIKRV